MKLNRARAKRIGHGARVAGKVGYRGLKYVHRKVKARERAQLRKYGRKTKKPFGWLKDILG